MRRTVRHTLSVLTLLVSLAAPAAAQDFLDLEYQYFNYSSGGLGQHMPLGVAAGYQVTIKEPWSLIGSIDWSRDSESFSLTPRLESHSTLTITAFSGGVRWTGPGDSPVFLQLLLGAVTSNAKVETTITDPESASATDFMFQLGAGFSTPLTERLSIVGQADYRDITGQIGRDGLRLAGGVRIRVR